MADQSTGLLSPYLKRARINASLPYIDAPILDVGCGNGALASYFDPLDYVGIDIDEEALKQAKNQHPQHSFGNVWDTPKDRLFKTIVLLACIEHLKDPKDFLKTLQQSLLPKGKIVITTPHPFFEKIYNLGSQIGVFSDTAQKEHQSLINRKTMEAIVSSAGLKVTFYQRFLGGANQLFILEMKFDD